MARFLALLELFRDGAVAFEQLTPLGELTVRWTGGDDEDWMISDEFDETDGTRRDGSMSDNEPRLVRVQFGHEQPESDNSANVAGALEALLLLAAEPVTEFELAQAVGVPESVVAETLAELVAFYEETGRGFELRQVGWGWRYYTREEHADLITRYVIEGQQSQAVAGRAGDAGGGRLHPADLAGPGVGGSGCQCGWRDENAAGPWLDRGGRSRSRVRCSVVRHHQLLPGTDGPAIAG